MRQPPTINGTVVLVSNPVWLVCGIVCLIKIPIVRTRSVNGRFVRAEEVVGVQVSEDISALINGDEIARRAAVAAQEKRTTRLAVKEAARTSARGNPYARPVAPVDAPRRRRRIGTLSPIAPPASTPEPDYHTKLSNAATGHHSPWTPVEVDSPARSDTVIADCDDTEAVDHPMESQKMETPNDPFVQAPGDNTAGIQDTQPPPDSGTCKGFKLIYPFSLSNLSL